MNSIIKPILLTVVFSIVLMSCVIQNASPEDCHVQQITINTISQGSSYDIVFTDDNGDSFYINRGAEQGLDLGTLKQELSGKKVNLHLYGFWFGSSRHISQLSVDDKIVYTEFN